MGQMHERAASVLAALSRSVDLEARSVEDLLAMISETAAATLQVKRVNIWLYDQDRTQIVCIEDFEVELGDHSSGAVLNIADAPQYFHALEWLREVATFDAHTDPRMVGLRSYLRAHGVSAMLDAPLLASGRVIGVVCHEHVGSPRTFVDWEKAFAGAIGDLVSLVLETDRRLRSEREQRYLAEQLARRVQVDSVGWIATGVAHDLRNLLTVVLTNVDMLRAGKGVDRALEHIERAAGRAGDLCTLLLESSGHLLAQRAPVDVPEVVREVLLITEATRPPDIAFDLDVPPDLPVVLAPGGGRVGIAVRMGVPADAPRWDFREGNPGTVVLEVSDSGRGMDRATANRCTEPFFTTKNSGSGHGFGLATVLGTVRSHQGAFDLETVEHRGTRVWVWLPVPPS
jgi:two-component system, cell cycle sensor histidine kinase and response regulator CckA